MKPATVITQDDEQTIVHYGLENQDQVLIQQLSQSILIDRKIWQQLKPHLEIYFKGTKNGK
jgi:hypothetical protein